MALIDCKFFSETLGMSSSLRVILPETIPLRPASSTFAGHPTLFLLHGLTDDESVWTRRTRIEDYANTRGLAVVMPNVHRSFYTNMLHGYRYWDFVSGELIEKARALFPLSHVREHNYVAGLSMGGYGAFKLALRMPQVFSAGASLSGVADVTQFRAGREKDYRLIFGDTGPARGSEHDLFHLASQLAATSAPKPRLYLCCGTEDFLFSQNRDLHEHLQPLGFDYRYEEGPGDHVWPYWDAMIERALSWLLPSSPRAS